jgi:hypothetical protein
VNVNCINRSRLGTEDDPQPVINIKALMAPMDILVDDRNFDARELVGLKTNQLFDRRGDNPNGVLVIYPISRFSTPKDNAKAKRTRASLGVETDIVGVAFVFPGGAGLDTTEDYVQADLQPINSGVSAETDDEEELDSADAATGGGNV